MGEENQVQERTGRKTANSIQLLKKIYAFSEVAVTNHRK